MTTTKTITLTIRATLYTALPAAAPDDRTTEPRTGEP